MTVPGPACGAAPVQPTVSSGAALVPTIGVAEPAQVGGTDSLPTMVDWPAAAIGAPRPAMPPPAMPPPAIGAVVSARPAASADEPAASAAEVSSRPPPAIPSRFDVADAQLPPPMLRMLAALPDRLKGPPRPVL